MDKENNLHYNKKDFYRRKLPHFQNIGGLFFVTYNLKAAIKISDFLKTQNEYEVRVLKLSENSQSYSSKKHDEENRRYFGEYDKLLHSSKEKIHFLNDERCAKVVCDTLHFWDNKRIELYSYCVMSNHVHAVLKVFEKDENGKKLYLQDVMESIKQFSARKCNIILGKEGKFWQNETYDRLVRDKGELFRIISYILDNPVKAGLCEKRNEWKWSYIKDDYNEFM